MPIPASRKLWKRQPSQPPPSGDRSRTSWANDTLLPTAYFLCCSRAKPQAQQAAEANDPCREQKQHRESLHRGELSILRQQAAQKRIERGRRKQQIEQSD